MKKRKKQLKKRKSISNPLLKCFALLLFGFASMQTTKAQVTPPNGLDATGSCIESTLSWNPVSNATYVVEMCANYLGSLEDSWLANSCGPVSIVNDDIHKAIVGGGNSTPAHIRSPEIGESLGGSTVEFYFKLSPTVGNANFYFIVNNHASSPNVTCSGGTPATNMAQININKQGGNIVLSVKTGIGTITGPNASGVYTYKVTLPSNANTQIPASSTYCTFGFYFDGALECYITGIAITTQSGNFQSWGSNYQPPVIPGALQGKDCHVYASRKITSADAALLAKLAPTYTLSDILYNGVIWGEENGQVTVTLDNTYIKPVAHYYWRVLAIDEQAGTVSNWSEPPSDYLTAETVTENMENELLKAINAPCGEELYSINPPVGWQWVSPLAKYVNINPFYADVIPADSKYCSEPRTVTITTDCVLSDIAEQKFERKLISTDCYTITGIKIDCNSYIQGMYIKRKIYDDGSVKSEKYVKK